MLAPALLILAGGLVSASVAAMTRKRGKRMKAQARKLITRWSQVYRNVTPEIGMTIAGIESDYDPSIINTSDRAAKGGYAWGMMQVLLSTATEQAPKMAADKRTRNAPDAAMVLKTFDGSGKSLLEPALGTLFGMYYLDGLARQFKGDFELTVAAYQQGPGYIKAALASGKTKADVLAMVVGPKGKEYVAMALQKRAKLREEGMV